MFIIGNGRMITQSKSNPYLEDGAIVIKDNLIHDIGSTEHIKSKYPDVEFMDAKRRIIMPGMINTHMHIYSSFARGMNTEESKNFVEILEKLWWKLDKTITLEDVKYSAYATYIDCIRNGTTTIFDHHASEGAVKNSLFTIAEVAKELNVRSNLCYEVTDRDGEQILEEAIEENINFIKYTKENKDDMLTAMFGLHASMTLSDDTLKKCNQAIEGLDTGFHVHVAEGIEDQFDTLKKYGKRVVERYNDYNMLSDKTIAVHGIHTNKRELEILKETNSNVVHNPESNMGNAVGAAPIIKMIEMGINLGLGTDGFTADMFESMKVANLLAKHHLCDPRVAWSEVPTMLFANNRKIAEKYISKPIGTLEKGALADVIVIDYIPHTPINKNNYNAHILFGIMGRSVDTTIINGKIVMKEREILVAHEDKILQKSRNLAKNMWSRI